MTMYLCIMSSVSGFLTEKFVSPSLIHLQCSNIQCIGKKLFLKTISETLDILEKILNFFCLEIALPFYMLQKELKLEVSTWYFSASNSVFTMGL